MIVLALPLELVVAPGNRRAIELLLAPELASLPDRTDSVVVCLEQLSAAHRGWVLQRQVRLACQMPVRLMILKRLQRGCLKPRLVVDQKDLAVGLLRQPDRMETLRSARTVDRKVIDWPAAAGQMVTGLTQPVLLVQTCSAQMQASQTHWAAVTVPERLPDRMLSLDLV